MERRVTAVELRPINLLTASQAEAALDSNEDLDEGPDTVVGLNAPNQYKRVVGGFYYSTNITGTKNPRAEIYFSSDTGVEDGKTVRVSGIHKVLNSSNVPVDLDVSGDFRVVAIDSPPWENRASYGGNRQTPGENVDSTVLFNPEVVRGFGAARELVVKSRISTIEATTTTAKIVFTSDNHFKVGDVVFVDLPTDTPFFGLDGLYRVKTADSNFIEFDFSSALDEPIDSASVTEERYVHATAQAAIRDGATWISPDNVVYVWNDIRWTLFSSDVSKDSVAPGPVTDLDATDEVDTISGSTTPTSRVTLTWTAPTKNADNSALDDLAGYTIWDREVKVPALEWEKRDITGAETTWAKSGLVQGKTYSFRVFARDSGGNLSTGVTKNHFVGVSLPTVQKPAAPTVTTYLGTIKVAYDDITASGLIQSGTAQEIEVYFSDVSGFTPSSDNFYGKFPANAGSYLIIPGTEIVDNTDYYIRLIVRDIFGNITEASDQVSIRARLSNIVTYDMIDVGTLTGQVIIGADIRTASEPFNDGGLILNADGLVAYNENGGQTFRIDAETGAVSIGEYLGRQEAATLFISAEIADTTYATLQRADSIALVAGDAEAIAKAAQLGVDVARRDLDAITEITPGTITVRLKRDATIAAINRGKPNSSATEINGSVIETGTILANQIGSGEFPVGVIYAGEISATKITSGTLTGRTVQTTATGRRVRMNSDTDALEIMNTNAIVTGKVYTFGTNNSQIVMESADGVSSFTARSGSVAMATNNGFCNIDSGGFTVSASPVDFTALGTGSGDTYNIIHSRNSATALGRFARIQLSGTGIRNVNVGASGILTTSTSDERLKQNIQPLTLGLNFIEQLQPKKFAFKDNPGTLEYGLIAQEVREVLKELKIEDNTNLVFEDESEESILKLPDGESGPVLGVEYMKLIPILINAVKELQTRVDVLEKERKSN